MSHIFDALLHSETERSGKKVSATETVTELLERAERQALSQKESEADSAELPDSKFAGAGLEPLPEAIGPDNQAKKDFFSADAARLSDRDKVFNEFPAVAVSPSAESRLVCLTDKDSPAAEAFRLLKVRLKNLRRDKPLKKVLITSTTPEEGKSFASANLACTLASGSGEKVLLLGGDLRRPALLKLFGVTVNSGLCEYLRGECRLTSTVYRLEGAGIWLLPPGNSENDPLEMIQSTEFPPFIEQLAEWFDWIIIDSPPVLPLADTSALVRMADGILLVTRKDVTEKQKLKAGLKPFESNKLIGAILNSSDSATEKDYYYYGRKAAAAKRRKVDHDLPVLTPR